MKMEISRKDYIGGECTHEEYYAQFVTQELIDLVIDRIGKERILGSKDLLEYIPLIEWDRLSRDVILLCGRAIGKANGSGGVAFSDTACVAMAAAREFKRNYKGEQNGNR